MCRCLSRTGGNGSDQVQMRSKDDGLEESQAKHLKQPEQVNRRLKVFLTEATQDNQPLMAALGKSG